MQKFQLEWRVYETKLFYVQDKNDIDRRIC